MIARRRYGRPAGPATCRVDPGRTMPGPAVCAAPGPLATEAARGPVWVPCTLIRAGLPVLVPALMAIAASSVAAQEPAAPGPVVERPAPGVQRIVRLETDRVRAVEIRYDPGAEAPRHTHAWGRVVYVLDGGTVELVAEDGSVQRLEVAPGMTIWRPAETHVVRNVGRTTVRTLEVEVKGAG